MRMGRIVKAMMRNTAMSEAAVAMGPSCRTDRIIAPNTTADPDVSSTVPSGRCRYWSTAAILSRSLPFQTDNPVSTG